MARHSDALLRPIGLNRPAIFAANAAERGQHRTERIDYGTDGPPTSENMYAEELLRAALGDTTVPHLCSHGSITHEGRGHDGTSALIDPVAERPAAV